MIQALAQEIFRNQFVPGDPHPDPHDVVFIFDARTVLCRVLADGESVFPRVADFGGTMPEQPVYLFAIEDAAAEGGHLEFYLLREKDSAKALTGDWQFENIRLMRTIHPKDLCFAAMTGFQLFCWYRDNTFCGRCGAKTGYSETERAIKCPSGGNTI
jgi:NAD+ diphosphatase